MYIVQCHECQTDMKAGAVTQILQLSSTFPCTPSPFGQVVTEAGRNYSVCTYSQRGPHLAGKERLDCTDALASCFPSFLLSIQLLLLPRLSWNLLHWRLVVLCSVFVDSLKPNLRLNCVSYTYSVLLNPTCYRYASLSSARKRYPATVVCCCTASALLVSRVPRQPSKLTLFA